jgi:hypothetical protein
MGHKKWRGPDDAVIKLVGLGEANGSGERFEESKAAGR